MNVTSATARMIQTAAPGRDADVARASLFGEALDGSEKKLREAAEQLVASALVVPLLEEVRHQPLDADLFGGGFGQDAFRAQLDQQFADRIVKSGNFDLVDTIYRHVMRQVETKQGHMARGVDKRG